MCHAPSFQRTDIGPRAVPNPSKPLPPPTTPSYYDHGENFVEADITYLQQDFSLMQPVANPGNWPTYQRYDYFVTIRRDNTQPSQVPSRPQSDSSYTGGLRFSNTNLTKYVSTTTPALLTEIDEAGLASRSARLSAANVGDRAVQHGQRQSEARSRGSPSSVAEGYAVRDGKVRWLNGGRAVAITRRVARRRHAPSCNAVVHRRRPQFGQVGVPASLQGFARVVQSAWVPNRARTARRTDSWSRRSDALARCHYRWPRARRHPGW